MKFKLILVALVSVLLSSCGLVYFDDPDCPIEESNKYMTMHEMAMDEFIDAEQDIGRSNDLEDWLNAMERLETSLEFLQATSPPVCLEEVHSAMVDGMSAEINAFEAAFDGDLELAQEWMSVAERAFTQHDHAIDEYNGRFQR